MSSWFELPEWPLAGATRAVYAEIGRREHHCPYLRLWLPPEPESEEPEHIRFPRNLRLEWCGYDLVGHRSEQHRMYDVLLRCGYRGQAVLSLEQPADPVLVARYERWESERGNLGISAGLLICVRADQQPIVRWERTGRLYGDPPSGRARIEPDGTVVELPPVPLEPH